MFQKDSETVASRLKFAGPSSGFTHFNAQFLRSGNIFFGGSLHGNQLVSPAALGPHGQVPLQTQGSVRYIVTFTSDDVGPPDQDPVNGHYAVGK